MFYSLSKLFWFVGAPSHLAVWLIVAAVVLLWRKHERAARRCAIASATILIVFGFTPAGVWMMHPIEKLYPRGPLPQHIDGILILGGGTDGEIYASRGVTNADYGLARLVAAFEVARQHPEARVVFSGGPFPPSDPVSEATAARNILIALGLEPGRIVLEPTSRNTWENFINTRAIIKPKDGETWLLVTSAFHMPRAMAIAAKVKWKMIPWPSDYMTATGSHYDSMDFAANLKRADLAVHEGIGMLAYRLSGKAH
jgi:uncharacterized SAM-binding protein YcdF (DUF218 family)